jgi:glutathione peroxidase
MKKLIYLSFCATLLAACSTSNKKKDGREPQHNTSIEKTDMEMEATKTDKQDAFYALHTTTLNNEAFPFEELRGKRILIVNTASECGFTPQYAQLQELYEMYKDQGFVVLGFPSNDFGGQEPGTNDEIGAFCQKNYGVSFPIMQKSGVLGQDKNEVYAWLTEKSKNGVQDVTVSWNFNKFLIDENGQWLAYYPSQVSPLDERIIAFAQGK